MVGWSYLDKCGRKKVWTGVADGQAGSAEEAIWGERNSRWHLRGRREMSLVDERLRDWMSLRK